MHRNHMLDIRFLPIQPLRARRSEQDSEISLEDEMGDSDMSGVSETEDSAE